MARQTHKWLLLVTIVAAGGCGDDTATQDGISQDTGGTGGGTDTGGTGGGSVTGGTGASGGTAGGGGAGSAGTGATGGTPADCQCDAPSLPVCGSDGQDYDAACGSQCVPVDIACEGTCPCAQSATCGDITCGASERCCDKCDSQCVPANSRIACPDDGNPSRTCPGAGGCAGDGESCTTDVCCGALSCCAGIPIPPGDEYCTSGPCPISDHNAKQDFSAVDKKAVLDGVLALPITRWRYKSDPAGAEHIGPMAQDFKATFEVGATDKMIFPLDEGGVTLAAIQALHAELQTLRDEVKALRANTCE